MAGAVDDSTINIVVIIIIIIIKLRVKSFIIQLSSTFTFPPMQHILRHNSTNDKNVSEHWQQTKEKTNLVRQELAKTEHRHALEEYFRKDSKVRCDRAHPIYGASSRHGLDPIKQTTHVSWMAGSN